MDEEALNNSAMYQFNNVAMLIVLFYFVRLLLINAYPALAPAAMIASVSGPELVLWGGVGEDGAVRFAVVVLVTVGRTIPTVCVGCVNGSSMTVEGNTWPAECTT